MGGRRRRGIVLVTTLVSLVLVIMIVTAVVNINIGSARLGSRFHERETALMAAHSGLEYALTRLQEDLTWRGAPRGADSAWKLILDGPQVRVYEGNGNVVGFLGRGSDRPSFFRIKFNYEDGSGGLDYLEDSAQEQFISSPYVSVNNLYRSKVLAVYPANAEGVLEVERYKDRYGTERLRVSQAEASHFLPPFTCNLIVEGLAGTALRDCQDPSDLANLNLTSSYQRPSWAVGSLASRKVEVYLRAQTERFEEEVVASAANYLELYSNSLGVSTVDEERSPGLRSLLNAQMDYGDDLEFARGQLFFNDIFRFQKRERRWGEKFKDSRGEEWESKRDYEEQNLTSLKWDEVPKANEEGQYTLLPSGTYVWEEVRGKNQLRYYPGYYPPPLGLPPQSMGREFHGQGQAVEVDPKDCILTIKDHVWVSGAGARDGLVVRTRSNLTQSRPIINFQENAQGQAPILSAQSNLYLEGATIGSGSLTAEGNLAFQGPSLLESDPQVGVSAYAKGNVSILPIENATEQVGQAAELESPVMQTLDNWVLEEGPYYKGLVQAADRQFEAELALRAQTFPDPGSQKLAWELYDDWKGRQKLLGHYETAALTLPDNHILQEGQKTYSGLNYEQVTALQSILNNPKGRYSDIKKLSQYYYGEDNYRFQERVRQGEEPTITLDNLEEVQRYLSPALASESFRERKSQQLEELLGKYESLKYTDQDLAGVVYAWGNITVGAGRGSNLHLRGALVAYGGDPQHRPQVDGEMNKGSMRLRAQHIELMMDGDYLQQLLDPQSPDRRLQRTMYAVY